MKINTSAARVLLCAFLMILACMTVYAKDDAINVKEPGVYIKTDRGLKRMLPNIVFNEEGILYVEGNTPARFPLKDVQYFVLYGKYDLSVLTLNPMGFFQHSPLWKPRFGFGKELPIEVKQRGADLYTVKPKSLMGRGYFSLWINDTAWDFVLD